MDRRVQDDGTVVVGGQVVPTGGSIPTVASVVSYGGNAGLQSTNVEGALDELDNEKAPNVHTHDDRYFTEVEVTNLLAGKSATSHTHDDRYYTESEVDAKIVTINNSIAGKANTVHTHDDRYYTESEIDVKLATILASSDLHENSKFDLVAMDGNGPGSEGPITPRLLPIGWGDFWANPTAGVYAQISADNAVRHDNQGYSFKVYHPNNTGQSLDSNVFAVSAGSVVTASVWLYGDGGPRAFLTLISSLASADPSYFQPAGSTYSVESSATFRPGATWTKVSVSMVVPAGHTKARLMMRSYADGNYGAVGGTIWWDDSASSMQVIPPSGTLTGEFKEYPAGAVPSGYLEANGGTFSGTTYPALAALYGDKYGTHSGDTYYLPKKSRKLPDTDWALLPLSNGWVNWEANGNGHTRAEIRRLDGITHIRGLIQGTARTNNFPFTIPAGFRQKPGTGSTNDKIIWNLLSDAGIARLDTFPTGLAEWSSGGVGYLSLTGIEFPAEDVPGTIMTIIKAD